MGKVVFAESRPHCVVCNTTSHVRKSKRWTGNFESYCASCFKMLEEAETWGMDKSSSTHLTMLHKILANCRWHDTLQIKMERSG
jgi:hypothetical protein